MQEEFKVVYMKLHPDTPKEQYDAVWFKADSNADGDLQPHELAGFFGFDYKSIAKSIDDEEAAERAMEQLDDDQILEALQAPAPPSTRACPRSHAAVADFLAWLEGLVQGIVCAL